MMDFVLVRRRCFSETFEPCVHVAHSEGFGPFKDSSKALCGFFAAGGWMESTILTTQGLSQLRREDRLCPQCDAAYAAELVKANAQEIDPPVLVKPRKTRLPMPGG